MNQYLVINWQFIVEGVTLYNFAFGNVRVSLFVVNTTENIKKFQSFSDDQLQCQQHFDLKHVSSPTILPIW